MLPTYLSRKFFLFITIDSTLNAFQEPNLNAKVRKEPYFEDPSSSNFLSFLRIFD